MLPEQVFYRSPERDLLDFAEGGFARRILVLSVDEPAHAGARDFLLKILAAAQLHLERDTLLAMVPSDEALALLPAMRKKQPDYILVFGLRPAQLGLQLEAPLYQPFPFYGATFLFAEPLSLLEPDKNKKTLLWRALQTLFIH